MMHLPLVFLLALFAGLTGLASGDESIGAPPFPPSTALAEGVSPAALEALSELVESFVEDEEVVGAELLVIVHGRTILHEAFGFRDRESEVPMQPGGVFCVRSMTKPLIGAAAWMLIEAGDLSLETRVADHLEAFDVPGQRDVTVAHLLRHQSGLPMSLIMDRDPRTLESLRAVADLGGSTTLGFDPGTAFRYSDQGTDTLAALIEVVTGAPAEEFVRERLLEPLRMSDSACVLASGHPLRERASSLYIGSTGAWTRYWSPKDAALFPIFLGSQGLYSTLIDYARFLTLYLEGGRAGDERLLQQSSVDRTLEPGPWPLPMPTGFAGLRGDYGTMMQLWTRAAEDGGREVVVFGHSGSDGTHAWAFPEQEALVLYFTQSRGTATGWRVEERLSELFLDVPVEREQAPPPLEDYLGYYQEDEDDAYRAIVRNGDGLALEVPGRAVAPLDYVGEDRWKVRHEPSTVLAFDRDEAGVVRGHHVGEHREVRFTPRADLPAAEEVAARIVAAHRLVRLAEAGVVRLRGRTELPKLGRSGESVLWLAWPDRWRVDENFDEETSSVAFDGTTLRSATSARPAAPVTGPAGEALRQTDPFLLFGGGRFTGASTTVIQVLRKGDDVALLVRAGDASAPASTLRVDDETGRVVGLAAMTFVEGLGSLGNRVSYSDFREVEGALLPWRTEIALAHPLIGTIVTVVEDAETGVEVAPGWFSLEE